MSFRLPARVCARLPSLIVAIVAGALVHVAAGFSAHAAIVKSVQSAEETMPSGGAVKTVVLPRSVDAGRSFVLCSARSTNGSADRRVTCELGDTQLVITQGTTDATTVVRWHVAEFESGVQVLHARAGRLDAQARHQRLRRHLHRLQQRTDHCARHRLGSPSVGPRCHDWRRPGVALLAAGGLAVPQADHHRPHEGERRPHGFPGAHQLHRSGSAELRAAGHLDQPRRLGRRRGGVGHPARASTGRRHHRVRGPQRRRGA